MHELNEPSETIVLWEHYRLWGFKGGTRGAPLCQETSVRRIVNIELRSLRKELELVNKGNEIPHDVH